MPVLLEARDLHPLELEFHTLAWVLVLATELGSPAIVCVPNRATSATQDDFFFRSLILKTFIIFYIQVTSHSTKAERLHVGSATSEASPRGPNHCLGLDC